MEVFGVLIGLVFGVGVWILAVAITGSTKRREQAWKNMQWPPEKEAQKKVNGYRLDQEEKFRQQARERREEINLIMLANLMRTADHENSRYAIGRAR